MIKSPLLTIGNVRHSLHIFSLEEPECHAKKLYRGCTGVVQNVRYRKHATRKHGVQADRYYVLTYKIDGKTKTEAVGWASEGVKPSEAYDLHCQLLQNRKKGQGPRTIAEMRAEGDEERAEREAEKRRQARLNISFKEYFEQYYLPEVLQANRPETVDKTKIQVDKWIDPVVQELPM